MLKCEVKDKDSIVVAELHALYSDGTCTFYDIIESSKGFEYVKPILKSISDLSILIKDEFEKYDGIRSGKANEEIINLFCEENGVNDLIENLEIKSLQYECVEWMFKNHYDVFGLIKRGLAIE